MTPSSSSVPSARITLASRLANPVPSVLISGMAPSLERLGDALGVHVEGAPALVLGSVGGYGPLQGDGLVHVVQLRRGGVEQAVGIGLEGAHDVVGGEVL